MQLFGPPKPTDVFTPGLVPLAPNNLYVSRLANEKTLKRGLDRNCCPVVYGDYGVGKTTLIRRYFREHEKLSFWDRLLSKGPPNGRVVYFASASGLTMPKVFETILEHLRYKVQSEVVDSRGSSSALSFANSALSIEAGRSNSRQITSRLVVTAPTDKKLLSIINSAGLTIIIDELHQASASFREELVPFIKASRVDAPKSNLVLIGTSADATTLVTSDPGIDRYITDTHVKPMSEDEARSLVTNGFKRLKITIPETIVTRVVSAASGAPSILQGICLDMAERANKQSRRVIDEDDLADAIKLYIQDKNTRMTRKYIGAIETHGQKRYRKQILHAIAGLEGDYATMENIRGAVSAALNEDVQTTALSGPLLQLKQDNFGKILTDVERESGGRLQNVSMFSDPMMKSYVLFMDKIATDGLVDLDRVREAMADTAEWSEAQSAAQ